MAPKTKVTVDIDEFIRTRDALATAFLTLSAQADKVAKAYVEHTNTVLTGAESLNLSTIAANINLDFNAASFAAAAVSGSAAPVEAAAGATVEDVSDGKKRRKRAYKTRDPNAPKRPLTAYFRFLSEMRPQLTIELAQGNGTRKAGDLSQVATERWTAMSEAQKKPYHDAYKKSRDEYKQEMEIYKARTGQTSAIAAVEDDDDDDDEDENNIAVAAPAAATESDDEDSDEETPAPPPPPVVKTKKVKAAEPTKSASPEVVKKTPKKKTPAVAPPTPVFNSINPGGVPASTPAKKRKSEGVAADEEVPKKKRGRPSNASLAAAAAAGDVPASTLATIKEKKIKSAIKKKPIEA